VQAQAGMTAQRGRLGQRARPAGNGSLKRTLGYLGRQRRDALLAYGALIVATHNFISRFPQGYATPIGERGTQHQLLAQHGAYCALYMSQFRHEEAAEGEIAALMQPTA